QRWSKFCEKRERIARGLGALETAFVLPAHSGLLGEAGTSAVGEKVSLFDLMKRPEVSLDKALEIATACGLDVDVPEDAEAREQVELAAIYDGYLKQQ